MTPYIIGPEQEAELERIKNYAEANPTPLEVMRALSAGEPAPGGKNQETTISIPAAFTVTYTTEVQPGPVVCRHLSVAIHVHGRSPHPVVVEDLMRRLGFQLQLQQLIPAGLVWEEAIGQGKNAVNVVEPMSGNLSDLGAAHDPR
jgi:hypothetical protein